MLSKLTIYNRDQGMQPSCITYISITLIVLNKQNMNKEFALVNTILQQIIPK